MSKSKGELVNVNATVNFAQIEKKVTYLMTITLSAIPITVSHMSLNNLDAIINILIKRRKKDLLPKFR